MSDQQATGPRVLGPLWSAENTHPKLDPRLCALVELDDAAFDVADGAASPSAAPGKRHEAASGELRRSGPLAFLRGRLDRGSSREATVTASVPVFITTRTADSMDDLESLGVCIRSRAENIATAEISLTTINLLEGHPDVLAVEWTGGAKPQGDAAASGAWPLVKPSLPPDASIDGRGTYIGIIDLEGFDIYHPAFVRDDDVSRLAFLWDQTAPRRGAVAAGRAPAPWTYGMEYGRDDLLIELNPNQRRRHAWVEHEALKGSHGMMVASLASGRGAESEYPRGVAPGAELIFVNTCASGAGALAAMTELADAVDYVFQRAGSTPCVVNISLGDDLGPRDGTSPVERFIDALLTVPGRCVVIAAGNSRGHGRHITGRLDGAGPTTEFTLTVGASITDNAVVEIWYDARSASEAGLSVEIDAPRDLGRTRAAPVDGLARAFEVAGTRVLVASASPYPNSENGLSRIELFPARAGGAIVEGEWKIRLIAGAKASCDWHAWVDHRYIRWADRAGANDAVTITSPGTCRSAITVGASLADTQLICWFSGQGPGRRGLEKPDLVARGTELTVACAASTRRYLSSMAGTSFAAPQVAGMAALLFQRFGRISAVEIKRRLLEMASRGAVHGYDPCHGFGRLEITDVLTVISPRDDEFARTPASRALETTGEQRRQEMGNNESVQQAKVTNKAPDLARPQDAVQLGDGLFELYQANVVVGRVLVEHPSPTQTLEHWGLYTSYRWPSSLNPRQETRFEYRGAAISASSFKDSLPSGSTYVIADCRQETLP